jgi:ATP-binding cassette subfamily B protein
MSNPQTNTEQITWRRLFKVYWLFLEEDRKKYIFWTVILIVAQVYNLVPALITGITIDTLVTSRPEELFSKVALIALAFSFISILATTMRHSAKYRLNQIQVRLGYRIRVQGFEKLSDLSLSWHGAENTGNKVQRIEAGTQAVGEMNWLLNQELYRLVVSGIGSFLAYVAFGIHYLALVFTVGVVVLLTQKYFTKRIAAVQLQISKIKEQGSGKYYEGINNLLTIKTLGAQKAIASEVEKLENQRKELSYQRAWLGTRKWSWLSYVSGITKGVMLLIVARDYQLGALSIALIYPMFSYFDKIYEVFAEGGDYFDKLIDLRTSIVRMLPIFESDAVIKTGSLEFPQDWQSIDINNVHFRYGQQENESGLQGVNMKIKRGEMIGIAGSSGGGKSTITKLLLQLYQPDAGEILVGGVDLFQIDHNYLVNHISVVPQESELFNFTLLENITLFKEFSQEKLLRALEIAQLQELVGRLPQGLDTLIGEKGYRMSGGERQRVAIARAIYSDVDIYIFDEATSHLDNRTEALIQESLASKLPGKTIISIAHRLSTLKSTDRIYVFGKGIVLESGSYDELAQRPGSAFGKLLAASRKEEIE